MINVFFSLVFGILFASIGAGYAFQFAAANWANTGWAALSWVLAFFGILTLYIYHESDWELRWFWRIAIVFGVLFWTGVINLSV